MKFSSFYIILLFFIVFYTSTTQAQDPWIDSVKKLIQTQKADTNKINTLFQLSGAYRFSYPDTALVYTQQALSIAEKLQDDNKIFWSIVNVSGCLGVLGNYTLELDYALKVKELSKRLNTPYTVGYSYGLVSDCYYNLGEYNTSLRYWREVVKICEQKLPGERPGIYANSSHIFAGTQQYDSALIYAKKSYELLKLDSSFTTENYGGSLRKSVIFFILGDAFAGLHQYDSALYYYRISIPFSDNIEMDLNKVDAYNGIAKVFKETNEPDSAISYAKKVLAEKITKKYPQGFLKAANLLAAVYELQKNADSSLKYLHISINIKDSLFNREKTNAFQNIIFKDQEKQRDIEAAKQKLQRQYLTWFLIALLIIAIIITAVVIRTKRIKQLQNMRNGIADDLHDDIGSALSSINIMSELAKQKSPEASPLLTSIGESTTAMQENMSDIIWMLKSGNDRFENVLQRMNLFASEILEAKNIALDFANTELLPALKLTMDQRKNFYLFFKEAINNAAKYSDAKKVEVCIAQKDYTVEMNISDDGKGFDTSKIFNGNGMSSLKKRAAELNADFKITSCINKGTDVQLKFKNHINYLHKKLFI
jgi:two-component system sensor histidine kinase UhpB